MSKSDEQVEKRDVRAQRRATTKGLPPTAKRGSAVADWNNAGPENVLRLVCAVGLEGGAVRFGYTRDGGAYSIGIYMGTDSKTYYCNDAEGINDTIKELLTYFQ